MITSDSDIVIEKLLMLKKTPLLEVTDISLPLKTTGKTIIPDLLKKLDHKLNRVKDSRAIEAFKELKIVIIVGI